MSSAAEVGMSITDAIADIEHLDGFGPWRTVSEESFDTLGPNWAAVYVEIIRPTGPGHEMERVYLAAKADR